MFNIEQSSFLHALGYAIAHSLWQMSLLWLVYFAAIQTRKWSSSHKYIMAVSLSFVGLTWFVSTLVYYTNQGVGSQSGEAIDMLRSMPAAVSQSENFQFFYNSTIATLRSLAPYLSCAYLVVMLMLSMRLANGFRQVKQLRTNGLSKANINWRLFVRTHASFLGIKKPVQLFISTFASSPLTIGFWRPIILIPLASINQLSTQQVEAVLLHELAHIRRHDYLLNIVLQIAEIALFFNPFMRLLLKQARQERENSCDDWVLQFRYNAADYARALLAIEQHSVQSLLALGTNNHSEFQLLNRVKRMLAPERKSFNYRQQLGLLFTITILALGFTIISPKPKSTIDQTVIIDAKEQLVEVSKQQKTTAPAVDLVKNLENIQRVTQIVSSPDFQKASKKIATEAQAIVEKTVSGPEWEKHLAEMEKQAKTIALSMENLPLKEWTGLNADILKIYGLQIAEPIIDNALTIIAAPSMDESTKKWRRAAGTYNGENAEQLYGKIAPNAPEAQSHSANNVKKMKFKAEELAAIESRMERDQKLHHLHQKINDSLQIALQIAREGLEISENAIGRAKKQLAIAPFRVVKPDMPPQPANNYYYSFHTENFNKDTDWKNSGAMQRTQRAYVRAKAPIDSDNEPASPNLVRIEIGGSEIVINGKTFAENVKKMVLNVQQQFGEEWTAELQQQVEEELRKELKGLEKLTIKTRVINGQSPKRNTIVVEVESRK